MTGQPSAALADTSAGAEAFTKFYLDQVNEAYRKGSTGQVADLALPSCKTCGGITQTISQLASSGQHYSGDFATPTSITTSTFGGSTAKTFVTTATAARQVIDGSGKVVDNVPASTINVSVFLTFSSGNWRVSEIQSVQ